MKKTDLARFKKRLEELRAQILSSLQGNTEAAKVSQNSSAYSQHQADQGTDDFDRTVTLELSSRELGILKQIERALEKIEDETYGICDISEKKIPLARLEAIPYATMTVEAQEKMEKGMI